MKALILLLLRKSFPRALIPREIADFGVLQICFSVFNVVKNKTLMSLFSYVDVIVSRVV
jgi:hypothetical protein